MAVIKMQAAAVHKRAKAMLKAVEHSASAGEALSRNFEQEQRLTNLMTMSDIAAAYGVLSGKPSAKHSIWIDEADAKALEFV